MITIKLKEKFLSLVLFALIICVSCTENVQRQTPVEQTETQAAGVSQLQEVDKRQQNLPVENRMRISKDEPSAEEHAPITEKVGNFITPTEYFTIKSKHFPESICAVSLPSDYFENKTTSYPMVLAFGGAGECSRSPRQGSLAWVSYYKADEAANALSAGKLKKSDFRGLVSQDELDRFNRNLHKYPYKGVILVCPYSPLLTAQHGLEIPEYERYIMDELLPALCRHYRVDRSRIGVDGVSMGGARSMYYGFKYPDVFQRVGSVQAAVGPFMDTYSQLIRTNRERIRKCSIQLVSSDGDVFLKSIEKFSSMLDSGKTPHSMLILKGPHDYIFNQGPGSLALLAFHGAPLQKSTHGPVR
jgi:hypothetical protein